MSVAVHHGDSREVLKTLADASIDSVVTDPPYALVSIVNRFGKEGAAPAKGGVYARASAGFMGQAWDTGDTAFDPEFWTEVYRVLKPGGHVVAFGGTRTYHRLACAIEDAGFEVRDQIGWAFGSGFPKSHNQKGDWDGWGTALKPAWEPICLARKPLIGTVSANLAEHGVGALNIDGCRVGTSKNVPASASKTPNQIYGAGMTSLTGGTDGSGFDPNVGRWPANVVHDGSDEVVAGFPTTAASSARPRNNGEFKSVAKGCEAAHVTHGHEDDGGSAARFFYTAKADAEDRLGSKHPTVKPIDLMAWLCRLVTPPGGVVLDPFAGTGTTGLAAMREGFSAILIEREAQYVADIERRLAWTRGEGRMTAQEMARAEPKTVDDLPLFGGEAA